MGSVILIFLILMIVHKIIILYWPLYILFFKRVNIFFGSRACTGNVKFFSVFIAILNNFSDILKIVESVLVSEISTKKKHNIFIIALSIDLLMGLVEQFVKLVPDIETAQGWIILELWFFGSSHVVSKTCWGVICFSLCQNSSKDFLLVSKML
jgi:hypothetical protein